MYTLINQLYHVAPGHTQHIKGILQHKYYHTLFQLWDIMASSFGTYNTISDSYIHSPLHPYLMVIAHSISGDGSHSTSIYVTHHLYPSYIIYYVSMCGLATVVSTYISPPLPCASSSVLIHNNYISTPNICMYVLSHPMYLVCRSNSLCLSV